MVLVLYLVRTVGQLLWYPASDAVQADLIPVEKRGRIMGLSGLMMEGVTVISSTLFGLLYVLRPEYAFYFSVGLEILCVLLILSQLRKAN
jgi:MFS family permease